MFENPVDILASKILNEKINIEKEGKTPKLILMDEDTFFLLENDWVGQVKDLPWGDSIVYEIEKRRRQQGKIFLGDGTIFGLWVVRVSTIKGFKIF